MQFKDIPGNTNVINKLIKSAESGRIAHAQIITGPTGSGKLILALAYAQFLNCNNKIYFKDGDIIADSCGECTSCKKISALEHTDLHFLFPVVDSGKQELSKHYMNEWRAYIKSKSGIVNINSWYDFIQVKNKQGFVSVDDIVDILTRLQYKNTEAKIKVIIIWMAEKIQYKAAPKILKTLEEPGENTLFLLISENIDLILPTILSRVQTTAIKSPSLQECFNFLKKNFADKPNDDIYDAVYNSNRDLDKAIDYLYNKNDISLVTDFFKKWMRNCFVLNAKSIFEISDEFASMGREKQKYYLSECAQNMLKTFQYGNNIKEIKHFKSEDAQFFQKFSPYIKKEGLNSFYNLINEAITNVERNGNPRIVFNNLSIDIGRVFRMLQGKK